MKFHLVFALATAAALTGCVSQPMKAGDVAKLSNAELCIDAARMYITGKAVQINGAVLSSDAVISALHARGEQCEPQDTYMKVAYERVQLEQQDAVAKAQQSQALSAALLGAAQTIQQQQIIDQQRQQNAILQQQMNTPVTTHCSSDTYGNTTCRSY